MTVGERPPVQVWRADRSQLTAILKNPELVRQIEALINDVARILPDSDEEIGEAVLAAQNTADDALVNALQALTETAQLRQPTYVTLTANATLPSERILTGSVSVSVTDGGAGNPVTVALTDTVKILDSSPSDITAAFVDAGNLNAPLAANATYEVTGVITYQAGAATTGLALGFTLPAGAAISGTFRHNSAATTIQGGYNTASGTANANTTDSAAAAANIPVTYHGIIATAAASGTAQMQFRSEVAASAITLQAALSYLVFRRIG